jgi:hypothetical protein
MTPGDAVYEGMLIGENSRPGDMDVNPCKEKKLSNMRSKGADEAITLEPPRQITLEIALEYIEDDELIEITPQSIRLRKRMLSVSDRKKVSREVKVALKLQNRVLADRVVRRQEGAEFQTVGSTTGVGLLCHEPTVGCGTRIADSST